MLVGGLVLARAVDDPDLSDRILAACRISLDAPQWISGAGSVRGASRVDVRG